MNDYSKNCPAGFGSTPRPGAIYMWGVAGVFGVIASVAGCSSSSNGSARTGGKTGAGQATGGSGNAGAAGSGSSNTGGGSPGAVNTGGRGGTVAGGNGPGGATTNSSSGGASLPDSGAPGDSGTTPPTIAYTFDTTAQSFFLNPFAPPPPRKNLAAPDSGAAPSLVHDPAVGSPTPGSLKLNVTFTDYGQLVDVVIQPQPSIDLSGRTLHAKVRLNSGTWPVGAGAFLHAGTGTSFAYGAGDYTSLVAGSWTDLSLDLTKITTGMFDPTRVVEIGIQFHSGDARDAGAFPGPVDLTIQIDSITDTPASAPVVTTVAYNFDTAAEGFSYSTYQVDTGMGINLAVSDAGPMATLVYDPVEGSPTPGSLRASATFSNYRQFVDVILGRSPAVNLMGKTLHAKVRLTSGTFQNGAGAMLHASTGAGYVYGTGPYTPLTYGVWTDLILNLATVTTPLFDPTMVVQLGIQLYSGEPPEAGAFAGPNDVVFHIDSITE